MTNLIRDGSYLKEAHAFCVVLVPTVPTGMNGMLNAPSTYGRCAVFGGGRFGHTEFQAQTHQKSVSWNVPEVGLAHDPRPGN
jgi:hypothetical protein